MISVAEARAILLAHAERRANEEVTLEECLGRTLAAPVVAQRAQPPFRASAMDGYAVRASDTPGPLMLAGEAGAGHAFDGQLAAGQCARIFTGAPLPDGADAVVIQEDAIRQGATITVPSVKPGKHVREPGVDFAAGATLLTGGVLLNAAELAAAAAAGRDRLVVARRPRVTILAGGDEIVAPGASVRPDQIYDSTSFGVHALAQSWGADSARGPRLRDDADAIASALEEAMASTDLVVLIGGASVGDHDHARAAARALGCRILFEKVALRPGKPTWFALHPSGRILGLPGNPGSALITARLFLRPMITAMLGGEVARTLETRPARLAARLEANGPREAFLRGKIEVGEDALRWVTPAANQDSSLVSAFTAADTLIVRAPDSVALDRGSLVDTLAM